MSSGDRQPAGSHVRTIPGEAVYRELYAGIREMNVVLPADVLAALTAARAHDRAESRAPGVAPGAAPGAACFELDSIIENAQIARSENLPMCQDTGLVLVFVEQGHDVRVAGDPLDVVIRRAIGDAYHDGKFRASVVGDPLNGRKNTGTNLPPVIYFDAVPGSGLTISCLSKGFGSENYSRTFMLKPTQTKDAVIEAVLETMKAAGGNCCPPVILGIGIGGTMDWAAKISKKALLRDLTDHHPDPFYRELEAEILAAVNALGIGAGGLGGPSTALGVHIETYPTHIAGLPVAVSVNCWAERKAVVKW
ncbi:MAG: fumarate hydratase [Spirochaetaceae bacterium]|nr:MAG: fumarate hydratase [Spirochaetaceae bacterium]